MDDLGVDLFLEIPVYQNERLCITFSQEDMGQLGLHGWAKAGSDKTSLSVNGLSHPVKQILDNKTTMPMGPWEIYTCNES